MAAPITYRPELVGDWGEPAPASGGSHGTDTLALPDGTPLIFHS